MSGLSDWEADRRAWRLTEDQYVAYLYRLRAHHERLQTFYEDRADHYRRVSNRWAIATVASLAVTIALAVISR